MIYIKLFICTLIMGILASGNILYRAAAVPEYFLCMSIACAIADRDKIRAVFLSIIFAVISSALADKPLIFCTIEYCTAAVIITELINVGFKKGFFLSVPITGILTLIGELVFYHIFIRQNFMVDFRHIILSETVFNTAVQIAVYPIVYRIYNPRRRRFKISIE